MRYKTNLQISDCLDTYRKLNQIFQPRRISLVFRQFAGAVRAISFPEFALLALPRSRNGGVGALRHSDSSSRSFAVIFLVCSVSSHTADSKILENHLKLVSCFVKLHFVLYLSVLLVFNLRPGTNRVNDHVS